MTEPETSNSFAPFWALYVVVVVLCVLCAALRGTAQLIAFAVWIVAAAVDVRLLVWAAR